MLRSGGADAVSRGFLLRQIYSLLQLSLITAVPVIPVAAQEGDMRQGEESSFLPRSYPYPQYYSAAPRDYNLRWGKLTGRLHGSLQAEFNDNINLSDHEAEGDVSFAPLIGVGFLWPISEENLLEFGFGLGYRAYLDHPELNSIQITPDSRLSYQIRVLKARIMVHDEFSINVDPLSRPEISGEGRIFNYRRVNNNSGFTATWEAIRDVTLIGGYSFVVDRSLNNDFTELDRNDHVFHLGAYRPFGSRLTAGVVSTYTTSDYRLPIQNDGMTLTVGPRVQMRLSDFISAEAGVHYTVSEFDPTGAISDRDDFTGLTYFIGLRHRLNSRVTQNLHVSRSVAPGYGSNFTEIFGVQYGVSARIMAPVTLNSILTFEDVTSSGSSGEDSQRYLWYLGTALRLSSKWNIGVGYSLGIKESRLPGRDYIQNRVTLDLTRHF